MSIFQKKYSKKITPVFINGDILWLRKIFLKEDLHKYKVDIKKSIRFAKKYGANAGTELAGTKIRMIPHLGNIYNRKINFSEFKEIFKELTDYGSFATDDPLGREYTIEPSFIFAYKDKVFFYGVIKNNFVEELSFEFNKLDEVAIKKMTDMLYNLGRKHGLMLVDWRINSIIDLSNTEEAKKYLEQFV